MPLVPITDAPEQARPQAEQPDPVYLMMAGAMMHQEGKLFIPVGDVVPFPENKIVPSPEDRAAIQKMIGPPRERGIPVLRPSAPIIPIRS